MGRRTCDLCGSEDKVWIVGGFARCEACEAVDAVDLLRSWTDPTPLTLDLLRRELGEPDRGGCIWTKSLPWLTWVENHKTLIIGDTLFVHTLGQLRRSLSVIEETNREG